MKLSAVYSHKPKKAKMSVFTVLILALLLLYTILLFLLLGWAFLTSLKSNADFYQHSYQLPQEFANQYQVVFTTLSMSGRPGKQADFWEILYNSVMYALGSAFFKTLVPCIAAYACARYHFKTSKVVYTAVMIAMIVPIVGSLPSELQIAYNFPSPSFHIYNNIWGAWILKSNMLGLYFFIMYSSFQSMPDAYFEAARIDGANNWQLLFKIALPLIKGTFMTVLLINFVEFWNDYQTPMIYLPQRPTMGYSVFYKVLATNDANFAWAPAKMAVSLMSAFPVVVLFCVFKDKLMGNLTMGGIKG